MHQLGIVGLSHRHASAEDLARFTIARADIAERLPALRRTLGAAEVAYIATCNRVEVIFVMPESTRADDLRPAVFRFLSRREPTATEPAATLRAWTDEAALEHLFLVACGMDSAQVGEREIASQLRTAWELSRAAGTAGPTLDRVIGEALAMARRIQRMDTGGSAPSLADLGAEQVLRHLSDPPGLVALIGVSPMTRRCGRVLREQGISLLVVNRSEEGARELATELECPWVLLDAFRAQPWRVAAVIVATGSKEPVLDAQALSRLADVSRRPLLIVDFCSPANVDPQETRRIGAIRVGLDELVASTRERRMAHLVRLAPARAAIDERLARLRSELATRAIGPQLARLRETSERIVSDELDKLLTTELRDLDDSRREALRRWGTGLAHRLAHLPLSGVRAAAEHASAEALEAFFEGARRRRP